MPQENVYEIRHEEVEKALRGIAEKISHEIPDSYGFTLLIFNFGPGGSMFYISNAERDSMVEAMKEFIHRQEEKHGSGSDRS